MTTTRISMEIDTELLQELNKESVDGRIRTLHVNRAIEMYLELLKLRRYARIMSDEDTIEVVFNSYLKKYIPEAARW